ncbi:hypothetical protein FHS21_003238 [Phyllobacterium trifolii]|uniref:PepSY domain-containing protein n=1 Tax=Phyllobacterium trifolii TaxID=300193 RepID=A0A839UD71_9HYPH|nr:PepSY domain-containing protein [Phyllobacterium trifolii]MBB3146822.1 hypothetical protein [Phyllobacterium trifolii]
MKLQTVAALSILLLSPAVALASPACTKEPKAKWMSETAMQKKIADLGYKVKTFETTGSCYEIYGWNKNGKKAEVYFNPMTGDIVKSEIDG